MMAAGPSLFPYRSMNEGLNVAEGISPRRQRAGCLHHAIASVSAGCDHDRHAANAAAQLGRAQRRLDY